MENLLFNQSRIFLQSTRSRDLFLGKNGIVVHVINTDLFQYPLYSLQLPFMRRLLTKILSSLLSCLKPGVLIRVSTIFIPNAPKLHLMQHMVNFFMVFLHFFIWLSLRGKVPFLFKLICNFGLPHKAIKPAQLRQLFILFLFVKTTIPKIFIRILFGKDLCLVRSHFLESQLPLRPTNLIFIRNRWPRIKKSSASLLEKKGFCSRRTITHLPLTSIINLQLFLFSLEVGLGHRLMGSLFWDR